MSSKILIISHNLSAVHVNKVKFNSVSSYTIVIGIKTIYRAKFWYSINTNSWIWSIFVYNMYNILTIDIIKYKTSNSICIWRSIMKYTGIWYNTVDFGIVLLYTIVINPEVNLINTWFDTQIDKWLIYQVLIPCRY